MLPGNLSLDMLDDDVLGQILLQSGCTGSSVSLRFFRLSRPTLPLIVTRHFDTYKDSAINILTQAEAITHLRNLGACAYHFARQNDDEVTKLARVGVLLQAMFSIMFFLNELEIASFKIPKKMRVTKALGSSRDVAHWEVDEYVPTPISTLDLN